LATCRSFSRTISIESSMASFWQKLIVSNKERENQQT
jgi:hypothetical protein